MATNGSQSYAIFNYLDNGIQWSSADSTGGVNGLGASGVQVGFNEGDGIHFFSRPETQSNSILLLDDNSNVCVPGKYVFRIDEEIVQPGRCVNIKPGLKIAVKCVINLQRHLVPARHNYHYHNYHCNSKLIVQTI